MEVCEVCDWWAVGCVVFEFLFGCTPFQLTPAENLATLVTRILAEDITPMLHANLAPMTELRLPDGRVIFGGVMGSNNHPKTGDNPLTIYLGWPGYDERLTTNSTLAKVLENTLDYLQSWTCGNCWPQYPPARVRAQDRETQANATWHTLLG